MAKPRKKWVSVVKTLIGIALLAALLLWNDNAFKLVDVFSGFQFKYIAALFLIALALNAISSVKWSLFLYDRGTSISQLQLFSLYLIGKFFNNFLPSMVGGDVARAYILGKDISSHSISAASVFLERATGMIGLAILAAIFAIINYDILANPIISVSIAVAVTGCATAVVLFYWPPLKSIILKIASRLPLVKKVTSKFEKLIDAVEHFRYRYKLLVLSLLFSIAFHLFASLNVYVTSLSIGFEPAFIDILVITPVVLLLTMIPVSPNNVGWWEWCFSVLLVNAGATGAEGLAVALTLRAVTLIVSLLGGLLFLLKKQNQSSTLSKTKNTEAP